MIKMLVSKERDDRLLGKLQTKQRTARAPLCHSRHKLIEKLNQGSRYKSGEMDMRTRNVSKKETVPVIYNTGKDLFSYIKRG